MTSRDAANAVLHEISDIAGGGLAAAGPGAFTFELDLDSALVWPDMPFDTASPSARYDDASRPEVLQVIAASAGMFGARAPNALTFVNDHLCRVLVRRSGAVDGASSASNREHVGLCVLTNMHVPHDRVLVCAEALVHEAIHQYLYRTELDEGNFCDLSDARVFRSPWSGNRIPLHSLVHASLVWFGLLGLWCTLARTAADPAEESRVRERMARSLFGFTFIRQLMTGPAFPRDSVQPAMLELIAEIARVAVAVGRSTERHSTLSDALHSRDNNQWSTRLAAGLRPI